MMPSPNFYLRSSKSKAETPVILTLFIAGKQRKFPTGVKVFPRNWDFKKQRIKPSVPGSVEKNRILAQLSHKLEKTHDESLGNGLQPTTFDLRESLKIKGPKTTKSFFGAFTEFLEVKSSLLRRDTIRKYQSTKSKLVDFQSARRFSLDFSTINSQFEERFRIHLISQGLLNDTISKYISCIKTFMEWALKQGYHENKTYEDFDARKKEKNEIVTLTEEELLELYEVDLTSNLKLEKVRDLFCFACFTGQRWSDFSTFDATDLKKEHDITVWHFISKKTGKEIKVPLAGFSKPALQILKKYALSLPLISQQKFNEYLKEVGKLIELDNKVTIKRMRGNETVKKEKPKYQYLSSHMARRTFITILLEKGVPVTTVQKISGHSSVKTLMKYENTSQEAVTKELTRIGDITKKPLMKIA